LRVALAARPQNLEVRAAWLRAWQHGSAPGAALVSAAAMPLRDAERAVVAGWAAREQDGAGAQRGLDDALAAVPRGDPLHGEAVRLRIDAPLRGRHPPAPREAARPPAAHP